VRELELGTHCPSQHSFAVNQCKNIIGLNTWWHACQWQSTTTAYAAKSGHVVF